MTIASTTEARRKEEHARSAEMHELLAATADSEGKFYMAALYRCAATGHRARIEASRTQNKLAFS